MRHEVERKTRRSLGHWVLHNRFAIQVASIIFANSYLLRHWKGFCYPVLNCWACPGASFACPIGVLQNASSNASYTLAETGIRGLWVALPLYTIGTLLLFSALFGRMMCGWLCPFGWLQEQVGRLRRKKLPMPNALSYLRYVVLVVHTPAVVLEALSHGRARGWTAAAVVQPGTALDDARVVVV